MASLAKRREPNFVASALCQLRTIRALAIRDAQAKYSTETLGFFWSIAEPLILTCGVIVLWTIIGRDQGHGHVTVVGLALTGYTHIQLWRMTVLGSIHSIRNNGWLLYHSNIHTVDIQIARAVLLSVSIFASFVIVYTISLIFGFLDPPRDVGVILAAWALDTIFCTSFALVVAALSELSQPNRKTHAPGDVSDVASDRHVRDDRLASFTSPRDPGMVASRRLL